jgi:uncharacterized protein (TIGR03437 family)
MLAGSNLNEPQALQVADINGDGKPDWAALVPSLRRVEVYLGDGTGNTSALAPGSPYAVGSGASALVTADFNSDGKLDLATANSGSSDVMVLLNSVTSSGSQPAIKAIVNAASNSANLAPDSYATIYGSGLTAGGTPRVVIRDSSGRARDATVIYAAERQVNFVAPTQLAPGQARVQVVTPTSSSAEYDVLIKPSAPGLFTANGSGSGPPAAQVVVLNSDGSLTYQDAAKCSAPGVCELLTIPTTSKTILVLYGTGFRYAQSVAGTIDGLSANVLFSGPQGGYPALDQINVEIPSVLSGRGIVILRLSADDESANSVTLRF